ncbi:hypothetical protein [Azospirillum sp. SYSU D00513]|uniref:hypothetical protein n=1 Tax=Azospirillum sp. SYSU D00513 TaxID=2812561 RepID=UPI001FFF0127|nr:hypothetical protein [Azospirillum sp. SYSU D00513]
MSGTGPAFVRAKGQGATMAVWRRYLVKETTGRLVELPARLFDRADDGTAPIPGFAGRCLDVVAAVLVGERGTPPRIAEVAFTKLYFDQSGYVDAGMRDRMIRLMLQSGTDREGRSDAHHALEREFGWTPAPAELSAVLFQLDPDPTAGGARTLH